MSAEEVAGEIGVSVPTVHRWERGQRLPSPRHIRRLALSLGVAEPQLVSFFDGHRPEPAAASSVRGAGLRRLRRQRRRAVCDIAEELRVHPATIYNWESGRVRIPSDLLPTLAAILQLELHWMVAYLESAAPLPVPPPPRGLRGLRRRHDMSQEDLASRLGVSRHVIGRWERSEAQPSLFLVRQLGLTLGTSPGTVASLVGLVPPRVLDRSKWRSGDLPVVLQTLRRWNGLTQLEVARRCGCSAAAVRSWEAGRTQPTGRSRERLEELYGLPHDALTVAAKIVGLRRQADVSGGRPSTRPSDPPFAVAT